MPFTVQIYSAGPGIGFEGRAFERLEEAKAYATKEAQVRPAIYACVLDVEDKVLYQVVPAESGVQEVPLMPDW